MRRSALLCSCVLVVAVAWPSVAYAQDVVMRRPLPVTRQAAGTTAWHTTPWVSFDANGNQVDQASACGVYTDKRDVTCRKSDGTIVGDYFCTAPKPAAEQTLRHDAGCSYSWDVQAWTDGGPACTAAKTQTRGVTCQRDTDRVAVPDSMCAGAKPDTTQQVADYSTCSHSWKAGAFVDPGASCTLAEVQNRPVTCERDLDKAPVDAAKCDPATKPATSQSVRDDTGCTYRWDTGAFVDPGSSCTRSETQTRDVRCLSSLGDEVVADAKCAGGKPSATQTVADYGSCQYTPVNWTDGGWNSTCSANATHTENAQCSRSNDGGEIVAGTECTSRGVDITRTTTSANYSSCTNSWDKTAYVDPGASCGTETLTRTVWCKRDLDGLVLADAQCDASERPGTTATQTDYSGCGYAGGPWSRWTYASLCSTNTTITRTRSCVRQDGATVADGFCSDRGIALSETLGNQQNYASCSFSWVGSGYQDPGASCTPNEVWTQTVWCRRDVDRAIGDDSSCDPSTRPSATQGGHADYSNCSYSAVNWSGWSYASTCSSNTTRTQTAQCRRSDGTIVADGECTSRGIALTKTEGGQENYSTCGYRNVPQPQSCSGGTQTVVNRCMRSDGAEVATSFCGMPATSQQSCTSYAWQTSGWRAWGQCEPNGAQYQWRDVWCEQKNGSNVSVVDDGLCSDTKPSPLNARPCTYYSYQWINDGWGPWSSTCSTSATRTEQYRCQRNPDGATVAAGNCGSNPAQTQTGNTSGCGYTPTFSGYSACSGGTQSRAVTCTRSDGVQVAPSYCGYTSGSDTRTCSMVVDCKTAMMSHGNSVGYTISRPLGGYNGTYDYAAPRPYFNQIFQGYAPNIFDNGTFSKTGNVCRVDMQLGNWCEVGVDAGGNPTAPGFCVNLTG